MNNENSEARKLSTYKTTLMKADTLNKNGIIIDKDVLKRSINEYAKKRSK